MAPLVGKSLLRASLHLLGLVIPSWRTKGKCHQSASLGLSQGKSFTRPLPAVQFCTVAGLSLLHEEVEKTGSLPDLWARQPSLSFLLSSSWLGRLWA